MAAEARVGLPGGGLKLAIAEAAEMAAGRTADSVLDTVADRLLTIFEREADQPLPADASATHVEEATEQAVSYMRLVD